MNMLTCKYQNEKHTDTTPIMQETEETRKWHNACLMSLPFKMEIHSDLIIFDFFIRSNTRIDL